MNVRDKETRASLVKLVIFIVVTTMATGVLVVLIGNLTFQSSRNYKADFTDVTGLVKGDDVRIAGVKVGSVKSVDVVGADHARVEFDVADAATVTRSSNATIRYRNLVGQRYISITEGVGDTTRLKEDATIPLSRTEPALDLTELFNGFKPLFKALSPEDINKLSGEMIAVFQGQGGNLEGLLANTAEITSSLAARDQVIGDLIENLNVVLTTIGDRDQQLTSLIKQFRAFMAGLVKDRDALLGPLDSISDLAVETADLTAGLRPSFVEDVKQLRRVSKNLKDGRGEIDRALQILPIKLTKIGRTAIYGSYFNFYLCHFQGRVVLPKPIGSVPVDYRPANEPRCNLS
jgi:phospholipid/cholesterol/gamma-HCH transport system substrate-binding protein